MANYQVTFNPATNVVQILPAGNAPAAGFTTRGNFSHPDPIYPDSKVMWHAVRDALYMTKALSNPPVNGFWPDNITDMGRIKIELPQSDPVIPVSFISPNSPTVTVAPSASTQNAIFYNPENSTDKTLTVVSSDTGVATAVFDGPLGGGSTATGVTVTGVAAGTATITLTSSNNKTATFTVTVE